MFALCVYNVSRFLYTCINTSHPNIVQHSNLVLYSFHLPSAQFPHSEHYDAMATFALIIHLVPQRVGSQPMPCQQYNAVLLKYGAKTKKKRAYSGHCCHILSQKNLTSHDCIPQDSWHHRTQCLRKNGHKCHVSYPRVHPWWAKQENKTRLAVRLCGGGVKESPPKKGGNAKKKSAPKVEKVGYNSHGFFQSHCSAGTKTRWCF